MVCLILYTLMNVDVMAIHDALLLSLDPRETQIYPLGLEVKIFRTPVLEDKNQGSKTIFTKV